MPVLAFGALHFGVQFFQRGFQLLGLAVGRAAFAGGLRLFGFLLFVLAHDLVQRFQAFVQRGEEGGEGQAQCLLRLVDGNE